MKKLYAALRRARAGMRSQRGVAMVTVLFVGAALTVVASAGAFVTIQEFRATTDDRTGTQSLSYAEAGIERMMLRIRDGTITWGNMSAAGCDEPAIQVEGDIGANGTYSTTMQIYDHTKQGAERFPPAACDTLDYTDIDPEGHYFVVESVGQQPAATRVVRQVVLIEPVGLPLGIYVHEWGEGRGSPTLERLSVISEGTIDRRDDLSMKGTDPYYTVGHFFPETEDATKISAAAHSLGQITYGPASKLIEHPPEPNCTANGTNSGAVANQSVWDSSGTASGDPIGSDCGFPGGGPPRSSFTAEDWEQVAPLPRLEEKDYRTLAEAAKAYGIYCTPSGNALTCIKAGQQFPSQAMTFSNTDPIFNGLPNTYIVFIDFPAGGDPLSTEREIDWKKTISPCSENSADHRSVVVIVRNGSIQQSGNSYVVGAFLIPEGQFKNTGSITVEGTIIAQRASLRGGATYKLSDCWVRNMPGPFLDATLTTWTEVDR